MQRPFITFPFSSVLGDESQSYHARDARTRPDQTRTDATCSPPGQFRSRAKLRSCRRFLLRRFINKRLRGYATRINCHQPRPHSCRNSFRACATRDAITMRRVCAAAREKRYTCYGDNIGTMIPNCKSVCSKNTLCDCAGRYLLPADCYKWTGAARTYQSLRDIFENNRITQKSGALSRK